jgi:hypothetical protein
VNEEQRAALAKLREPFEPHQISKLCRPIKRDGQKGKCDKCGGYHALPAITLDYVGHAALTDRLLKVDPEWNWEPVAWTDTGQPAIDRDGGMWIKLTVCGITRYGYGDSQDKTGPNATKERIGDALRNAAMRFGAALDLWHKGGDLYEGTEAGEAKPANTPQQPPSAPRNSPILAKLQAAAARGTAALSAEFKAMPNHPDKTATWAEHGAALKAKAAEVDAQQAAA